MSDIKNLPSTNLRKTKGRILARVDAEQKMLNSGPLGASRLIMNIAFDFMEKHPGLTWEEALLGAHAYFDRTHN
jgi:hypothetical protein